MKLEEMNYKNNLVRIINFCNTKITLIHLLATNPTIRAINEVTKYDSLEVFNRVFFSRKKTTSILLIQDISRSPAFIPLISIEDVQAICSIDVHPTDKYFAVGSNSEMLRVCAYPDIKNIPTDSVPKLGQILYKKGILISKISNDVFV